MPRIKRPHHPRRRPGGRSARVVTAVHAAVLQVLAEGGYEELSVADVAKRAGIHETSIYRRWQTKAKLVSDAIIRSAAEGAPVVDTGTFHGDILALLHQVVARLHTPLGNAVGRVVASQDPGLATLRREYWASRLQGMRQIVLRAQARGEMPLSFGPELALELFSGPILLRLTSGKTVGDRYLENLVPRVTVALKAKPVSAR